MDLRRVISAIITVSMTFGPTIAMAQSTSKKIAWQAGSPRIVSYNELIKLSGKNRELYLKNIRQMLVELSFVKHSLDGRLVADNEDADVSNRADAALESLNKFTALFAAYESVIPTAEAFDTSKYVRPCSAKDGYSDDYNPEHWDGVTICHLRYGKCFANDCEIENESACLEKPGHVLITYNSGWINNVPKNACIRKEDYNSKIVANPKMQKRWDLHLSPKSAEAMKLPTEAVPPSERPAVENAVGPQKPSDVGIGGTRPATAPAAAPANAPPAAAANAPANAPSNAPANAPPSAPAPNNPPNPNAATAPSAPASAAPAATGAALNDAPAFEMPDKCLARSGKTGAAYRVALEKYHKTSLNKCIYAGNLMTYGSKKNGDEDVPDIRSTACSRTPALKLGDATVKCADENQVLCNPLLFGTESNDGNNFVGRCVDRGAGATAACETKVTQAGGPAPRNPAQRGARRGSQRRRANANTTRIVPAPQSAPAAPITEAPIAPGISPASNFLLSKVSGVSEAWNAFAKEISDLCGKKDDLFVQVHCDECAVIKKRLTAANDAIKAPNAPTDTAAPRAPATNAPAGPAAE